MKIKRFHEPTRAIERTPLSLNVYFSEIFKITAKEKPYKNVHSKKYNDMMFKKHLFHKPISKMP
jgi:hypothetical protein